MDKVVVLGAGSWGTALAVSLASKDQPVWLWCRNEDQARQMQKSRENHHYLPEIILSQKIHISTNLEESVKDAKFVVLAVPSQSIRDIINKIKPMIAADTILVNVAKGLETGTMLRLSQVAEEVLPGISDRFVALYGPSHAEEVGKNMPTTIVAASTNQGSAEAIQDLFMGPALRVYTNSDLIGVEIGGALKNVVALATGIAVGLGFGDNTLAGLLTRGMVEIARLGEKLGADVHTFAGLTGIGDLVVTCTSNHSRNRRAGVALGQGKSLDQVLADMGMVVEGVKTTKAAVELARSLGVSMPIAEEMYRVLFEGADVHLVVENLMGRSKKSEKAYLDLSINQ